jgi:Tol biopolymer transport system component
VVDVDSAAVYASGYLLFVRDRALLAQRFNAGQRRLEGMPILVAANVAPAQEEHGLTFSASGDVVSYLPGGAYNELAWFDRAGRRISTLEKSAELNTPSLSPEDALVLTTRPHADVGNEIWIAPTSSGTPSRLDTGLPQGALARWSPDGSRIAFTSAGDLYVMPAAGNRAELLMKAASAEEPLRLQDWSQDGRYLMYYTPHAKSQADLWWFSFADGKAHPFRQSGADEGQGQFSADGHWLAYASDETGQEEVYVERFPERGSRHKISISGGAQPQWRRDGRELLYLSLDNELMSLPVDLSAREPFGKPEKLFHIALNTSLTDVRNSYAISRDGTRFLFSAPPPSLSPVTVRFNWTTSGRE